MIFHLTEPIVSRVPAFFLTIALLSPGVASAQTIWVEGEDPGTKTVTA